MGASDVFDGMEELYDRVRPALPEKVAEFARRYIRRKINCVLDVGCGTGLSIPAWLYHSEHIIGIEPNEGMRNVAEKKYAAEERVIIQADFAEKIDIPDNSVDVISCVQVFHWLDTSAALEEFSRVLKPGGILITCDFGFPPVSIWKADKAYSDLLQGQKELDEKYPELNKDVNEGDKRKNLQIIQDSGIFAYCREIVMDSEEKFNAQRYIDLAFSQSTLQRIVNAQLYEGEQMIRAFEMDVSDAFSNVDLTAQFCIHMCVGIKK